MIRVAAAGDLHAGTDSRGTIGPQFADVAERADVLLLAGDLTKLGREEEARVLLEELAAVKVPMVAVLGNHDHHSGREQAIRKLLEEGGIAVLEGEGIVLEVRGTRLGVAGTKGFGGGFAGASASEFGEEEMKAFIRHTHALADGLRTALRELDADVRVALLHYAPIAETLEGEPPEIYPFLGSYLLGEAVDEAGADLVVHGHAHRGLEKGATPGGTPVRNVAQPVVGRAYQVYRFDGVAG